LRCQRGRFKKCSLAQLVWSGSGVWKERPRGTVPLRRHTHKLQPQRTCCASSTHPSFRTLARSAGHGHWQQERMLRAMPTAIAVTPHPPQHILTQGRGRDRYVARRKENKAYDEGQKGTPPVSLPAEFDAVHSDCPFNGSLEDVLCFHTVPLVPSPSIRWHSCLPRASAWR